MRRAGAWGVVLAGLLAACHGPEAGPPQVAAGAAPSNQTMTPAGAGVDPWAPLEGWAPYGWGALQREVEARLAGRGASEARALLEAWRGTPEEAAASLAGREASAGVRSRLVALAGRARAARAALQAGALDEALAAAGEALALDEALWSALGVAYGSGLRRALAREVGEAAYLRGRAWAARGQVERACELWRRAYGLTRKDALLNRALGWCSARAARALEAAPGCEGLAQAARLATAGDGLAEEGAERARRLGCR